MASCSDKANGKVLFAVGDKHYSVAEIARLIAKYIGGTTQSIEWPKDRKAIEIGDAVISNERIKDILNWRPKYDFQEGLIKTKEYFMPCLKKYLKG